MNEVFAQIAADQPHRIILYRAKPASRFGKIVISRKPEFYQLEKFTATQTFHENIAPEALAETLAGLFGCDFAQLDAEGRDFHWSLRETKAGPPALKRRRTPAAVPPPAAHDRQKRYLLPDGVAIAPLIDLGVLDASGRVVPSMYDKYRQINRFLEFVEDTVKKRTPDGKLRVVDFGCGKSYLTFVLYYYLVEVRKFDTEITGLDLKVEVVADCNRLAAKYGYRNLRFLVGNIADYDDGEAAPDMMITLHACDTATDYALFHAIRMNCAVILSVPCCQHELNQQIHSDRFELLTRYGIVKERVAALMTDSLRAAFLESRGYRVQLLEFVELAHTPKNLLIRAEKIASPDPAVCANASRMAGALMKEFDLAPTLHRLLAEH
ncbi:MAG: SAM-dependent methyltransferase [Victivallaceae bacterium]